MSKVHLELTDMLDLEIDRKVSARNRRARYDRWQPGSEFETVLFFRGDYTNRIRGRTGDITEVKAPFYIYYQAFVPHAGRNRKGAYVLCRCRGGTVNTPCLLHDLWRKDYDERLKNGQRTYESPYRPRRYYAFNIVRLGYFHTIEVSQETSDGVFKNYMRDVKCLDPRDKIDGETYCTYCKQGVERWFGKRSFLTVGAGNFAVLLDLDHELRKHCECGDAIRVVEYVCAKCGVVLVPQNKIHILDENFWKEPVVCHNCGFEARPKATIACSSCDNPTPLTLFGTPVQLKIAGNDRYKTLMYSIPDVPIKYEDPRIKNLLQPYDFAEMFSTTTAEQATLLGISDPYSDAEPVVAPEAELDDESVSELF